MHLRWMGCWLALAAAVAAPLPVAVNLRTAKVLGLTIPPSLLARADEVIQ